MYDLATRRRALGLLRSGRSVRSVSVETGVSRATLVAWAGDPERAGAARARHTCWRCHDTACAVPEAYAYLLGQYLGDGYLVVSARVPKLRVACADDYPGIAAAVDAAIVAVCGNQPGAVHHQGCTDRYAYWTHWTCVLPQHGPGPKHTRPIVLAGWQREIVSAHPWPLIRGLIHSDGCRSINRVAVRGRTYRYPRYLFANESRDILAIMGRALDAVGVEWRYNRPNSISVARRAAVAVMDHQIGPKY